jgi:sigma-54 dependent transcriptional regulator, acetoin dehydrogenase operon transcriptional activator AcoR
MYFINYAIRHRKYRNVAQRNVCHKMEQSDGTASRIYCTSRTSAYTRRKVGQCPFEETILMRTNSPMSAPALRHARLKLLEDGDFAACSIDERLARSWRRSLAAGLSPTGRLHGEVKLSGPTLQRSLARNHELVSHSQPIMEYLFEQVRHSHSLVVLADNRGVLMHTLGDADFLGKAERVALMSGACWHEQQRGTNAIGTALAEASGIEIHGTEHYLERNGFLTCAAAPIVSATGELLGIIDISGHQLSRHPHTLGLVNTAARMIENRLVTSTCQRQIRLHFHAHPEGIGTVAEGIIALSDDGWIVGANRLGLALLGLAAADIGATPLSRVLDARLDRILAVSQRRPQQAILLSRHDGTIFYAQVHAQHTPHIPGRRLDTLPTADALARLDTGDPRWRAAAEKARRIVGKHIPLLLQGESGVGKELFAHAVHECSPQRDGPFVAINCAALPENLIEAELFGYAPGAFTGARKEGCSGRLREAEGGTLFLDEIGDMPMIMQTRLLRVLQERQVTPLGGGQPVKVDFALICATHHNLHEAAETGRFRSDLYYRINGLTLNLPALRERSDFTALAEKLLLDLFPDSGFYIAPTLLVRLTAHHWPGNLRQLASVLRTAVAMLDTGENRIDWPHLPDDLIDVLQRTPENQPSANVDHAPNGAPLGCNSRNLAKMSMVAIQDALESTRGNVSIAARQLGISRQTLYRKLKLK